MKIRMTLVDPEKEWLDSLNEITAERRMFEKVNQQKLKNKEAKERSKKKHIKGNLDRRALVLSRRIFACVGFALGVYSQVFFRGKVHPILIATSIVVLVIALINMGMLYAVCKRMEGLEV